jgi:DNA-binding NarL/FixJ family response regulator
MSDYKHIKPGTPLSKREQDVLIFVGKGCTNAEIARLLNIAETTVGDHLKRIFRRLDTNTRVEAAVWAAKQGWL